MTTDKDYNSIPSASMREAGLRDGIRKRPVYIFAFGEYNSKQVNASGIQHYFAQI